MRDILYIIVHCSATPPEQAAKLTGADIDRMHRLERGWTCIGYHRFIRTDGTVDFGRPLAEVGAHARPLNRESVGVCYAGGLLPDGTAGDTRTPEQRIALASVIAELLDRFPGARVIGHRDVPGTRKACPCFDAAGWWRETAARRWVLAR